MIDRDFIIEYFKKQGISAIPDPDIEESVLAKVDSTGLIPAVVVKTVALDNAVAMKSSPVVEVDNTGVKEMSFPDTRDVFKVVNMLNLFFTGQGCFVYSPTANTIFHRSTLPVGRDAEPERYTGALSTLLYTAMTAMTFGAVFIENTPFPESVDLADVVEACESLSMAWPSGMPDVCLAAANADAGKPVRFASVDELFKVVESAKANTINSEAMKSNSAIFRQTTARLTAWFEKLESRLGKLRGESK